MKANSFITDKQTLDDLNMLGKYNSRSVYHLYNRTVTRGGEQVLEEMFRNPLTDAGAINGRSALFQSFKEQPCDFPFTPEQLDSVEFYLSTPVGSGKFSNWCRLVYSKSMIYIAGNRMYELLGEGMAELVRLFRSLLRFCEEMTRQRPACAELCHEVERLSADPALKWLFEEERPKRLSLRRLAWRHYQLRVAGFHIVKRLLHIVYELDVYISVGKMAAERGMSAAIARPATATDNRITVEDLFHPAVQGAKPNSLALDHNRNVLFLTGANMAGKSTFMKSFAIAVYVAHIGLPVPARWMEFTVQDGLYTSINVSDNLSLGQSHFYAEVLRVKSVAEKIAAQKNLVVIFDELFKGTNVKDAYDATVAVVEAFAAHRNSTFIISTHILEAGRSLKGHCENFKFAYFPTIMEGSMPRYTYKLTEGITEDRHGMTILRNEKILDIIKHT